MNPDSMPIRCSKITSETRQYLDWAGSKVAFPVKYPLRFIGWTKAERDAFVLTGQVPQRIETPLGEKSMA